jgi:hypothetical protein
VTAKAGTPHGASSERYKKRLTRLVLERLVLEPLVVRDVVDAASEVVPGVAQVFANLIASVADVVANVVPVDLASELAGLVLDLSITLLDIHQ